MRKRLRIRKPAKSLGDGTPQWLLAFDQYVDAKSVHFFVNKMLKKHGAIKVYVAGKTSVTHVSPRASKHL